MQIKNNEGAARTKLVIHDYPQKSNRLRLSVEVKGTESNHFELAEFIESHSETIRNKYLGWVFELGQVKASSGKRISDLLSISSSIDLWKMSLLEEKSIFKTPEILDALQIIALQELILKYQPETVILNSENQVLAELVENICVCLNVGVENARSSSPKGTAPEIKTKLGSFRAVLELVIFGIRRLPFRLICSFRAVPSSANQILLASYFENYSINPGETNNVFQSNYWADLPKEIISAQMKLTWLEIIPNSDSVRGNIRNARVLKRLNKDKLSAGSHFALESFISLGLLIRAFRAWKKATLLNSEISSAIDFTSIEGITLSPLFRGHWVDSISGKTALRNIIWSLLFERFFSHQSNFSTCIYLQENQAWESVLVDKFRRFSQGRIIGFPHASIRYWDLRYFFDRRNFSRENFLNYIPDITIANGDYAKTQLLEGNTPGTYIREAEALRYLEPPATTSRMNSSFLRVLVIGEYDESLMLEFIDWLSGQKYFQQPEIKVIVKPHPNMHLNASQFTPLHVEFSNLSLSKLLPEIDLVIVGGMSSAAAEVFLNSTPLFLYQKVGGLDLGPLRGIEVSKITSSTPITSQLVRDAQKLATRINKNRYFYTDRKIPQWKSILNFTDDVQQV